MSFSSLLLFMVIVLDSICKLCALVWGPNVFPRINYDFSKNDTKCWFSYEIVTKVFLSFITTKNHIIPNTLILSICYNQDTSLTSLPHLFGFRPEIRILERLYVFPIESLCPSKILLVLLPKLYKIWLSFPFNIHIPL